MMTETEVADVIEVRKLAKGFAIGMLIALPMWWFIWTMLP